MKGNRESYAIPTGFDVGSFFVWRWYFPVGARIFKTEGYDQKVTGCKVVIDSKVPVGI
jgi:hypothetical protein